MTCTCDPPGHRCPVHHEPLLTALRELDAAVSAALTHRDQSPALDTLLTDQARIHMAHPEAFR